MWWKVRTPKKIKIVHVIPMGFFFLFAVEQKDCVDPRYGVSWVYVSNGRQLFLMIFRLSRRNLTSSGGGGSGSILLKRKHSHLDEQQYRAVKAKRRYSWNIKHEIFSSIWYCNDSLRTMTTMSTKCASCKLEKPYVSLSVRHLLLRRVFHWMLLYATLPVRAYIFVVSFFCCCFLAIV